MMYDAPTNPGKHVMTNVACVRSQRFTHNLLLIDPYDRLRFDVT